MSPGTSSRAGMSRLHAVTDDLCVGRGHLLQGSQRLFGLRLLHHAEHRVEHDNGHDRDRIDDLTQQKRHDRRHDQDDHEEVIELGEQQLQEARARALRELVGPVLFKTGAGLLAAQAQVQMGLHAFNRMVDREGVYRRIGHVFSTGISDMVDIVAGSPETKPCSRSCLSGDRSRNWLDTPPRPLYTANRC